MNQISRRGLLRSGAAAGVLAASGLPVMAQTQRGGRLRAGLSGADRSDSFDGRTHMDIFMIATAQGCVFDSLTEIAADGSLRGELAESWDASSDAKTWTFKLRRGVTFHNGKAFGADDVIASLWMHMEAGATSAARPVVATISEMKKVTDHLVQFTLEAGNADFPYMMSDYHLLMYPAGQIEEAIAKGIGTGLYRTVSFDPGMCFVGVRVADHYKGDTAGWFDEIEYFAINDTAARTNALMTGQVDAINRTDFRSEERLRASRGVRIQEVTGNQHYTFPMLSGVAPFDQLNVRRALKYGIDRRELVDTILQGHGQVASDTPIGPANQYFAADMEPPAHDPDKARFYLKQAGLASLDIDLSVSDTAFDGAVDAAQAFRNSASAAGIVINVVQEPAGGYWSDVWLKKPFCACSWSGRATEDLMFATAYLTGAPWNDSQWDHPRFQELVSAARTELDSETRRLHYREMQQILRDDGATLIPMFANYVQAVSEKVSSPVMVGNQGQMDNGRMAERWWMA